MLTRKSNGRDMRIVAGAMRGGEALVVRGDTIKKVEDFRGKQSPRRNWATRRMSSAGPG